MSEMHDLCKFVSRPISHETHVEGLSKLLKSGIPATYTIEDALQFAKEAEEESQGAAETTGEASESVESEAAIPAEVAGVATEETPEAQGNATVSDGTVSTTTPLHLICTHIPRSMTETELSVAKLMIDLLFEYGAGWSLLDVNNETPGCILARRGLKFSILYQQIVAAGLRAELLLRKVSEFDVEFIEDPKSDGHSQSRSNEKRAAKSCPGTYDKPEPLPLYCGSPTTTTTVVVNPDIEDRYAPSHNTEAFLKTRLEYLENALVTRERKDGVMMSWEEELMQEGCDSLFRGAEISKNEVDENVVILNIGFGMGIIDTMIQAKKPQKHYICEAHPDVLAKMRADGWFEKENVVVLGGRWQDELQRILSLGEIFFNGIYYDTFSEKYEDMLVLFDYVVGLLKPQGVFSFFNGLGADREVVYDVYKALVEIDLNDYGLRCDFYDIKIPVSTFDAPGGPNKDKNGATIWNDVKRPYWKCPVYYHPEAKFH